MRKNPQIPREDGMLLSRDVFLRGALILTIAGMAVKVIGAANRIFLSRLLGGEGIGLYQMAYPIYLLALNISYAGIPIAISILIAERVALRDRAGVGRVFRLSLILMVITGLLFSALLYASASWLIEIGFVQDPRAYWAIVALSRSRSPQRSATPRATPPRRPPRPHSTRPPRLR